MDMVQPLTQRVQKTQHGFTDIQRAAEEVFANHSRAETFSLAKELFAAEVPQARMLATFLFGKLAAKSKESFSFLRKRVSQDANWLADSNPNVRRAVTEGLRIWTTRDYFREHPEVAVQLLGRLHADESEYVRKSVGNALRDVSRKHKDLVRKELQGWDISDKHIRQTYKLASKFL